MGVELNFRVHSSQGGELGGKGKDGKGIFYSLLGTVVLVCLYKCTLLGEIFRSAMRAEIKKVSFSDLLFLSLPYLRIGKSPFSRERVWRAMHYDRTCTCLFICWFVRSFVSLFIVAVVIGRRRYGSANRTITSFITLYSLLVLSLEEKKMRQRTPSRLFLTEPAK